MSAVTSCAPCVFGAVSTSLLTFPIDIGTVQVTVVPIVTIASNGSIATSFETSSIVPTVTPGGVTPTTTLTFTDISQITWTTQGTTLTYPTTYVDYLAFEGAGAAAGSCAQTLTPTSLTLPANAPAASLVYPLDRSNALPGGLISYLNGAGGFPAQLDGNRLQTCAALPGALPPTASLSSVLELTTSPITLTSAIVTTIPPPTTYTTTISSSVIASRTVAATQAVALSTGLLFNTVTANPLLLSGSVSSSLTAPLAVTLAGGSTTVIGAATTSAVDITKVLSSISVSVSGPYGIYTNSTTPETTARLPPTGATTTGVVAYTGAAAPSTARNTRSLGGVVAAFALAWYL